VAVVFARFAACVVAIFSVLSYSLEMPPLRVDRIWFLCLAVTVDCELNGALPERNLDGLLYSC